MSARSRTESTRPISDAERAIIEKIADRGEVPDRSILLAQLDGALVSRATHWVLDIEVPPGSRPAPSVADGPLNVRALVPNETDYRGEILVWIKGGFVTGLEYAYITDEIPDSWPALDEIQVGP